MDAEGNYVDTHGQSEIGFGVTRLLGFGLPPRIKAINRIRLYQPVAGQPDAYPLLASALTRPIRWDLVKAELRPDDHVRDRDQAGHRLEPRRSCAASPAPRPTPPTRRRWKSGGPNVVEAFNGANSVIYYGKGGEIASNRHDEQEMTALCLRILQASWST